VSGRLAVQDALDKHTKRAIDRNRSVRRGVITSLHPITVDVTGFDHALTATDDFEMSQWMIAYNQGTKLRVGDTVLLHQEEHEWVMVDVISDALIGSLGGAAAGAAAGGAGALAGAIVASRGWRNGALALTTSGWNKVPLDSTSYDTGGMVSGGRINISVAGYYQVNANAFANGVGAGFRATCGIAKNGTIVVQGVDQTTYASVYNGSEANDVIYCVAGDFLELNLWTSAGTSSLGIFGSWNNFLSCVLVTAGAGPQGPPGPVGPPGTLPPGSGDQTYVFTQISGAVTWTIAHNLAKFPSVTIVDSASNELVADVHHVDNNNLTITFANATAGRAFMN
jgi:hypothetical protein